MSICMGHKMKKKNTIWFIHCLWRYISRAIASVWNVSVCCSVECWILSKIQSFQWDVRSYFQGRCDYNSTTWTENRFAKSLFVAEFESGKWNRSEYRFNDFWIIFKSFACSLFRSISYVFIVQFELATSLRQLDRLMMRERMEIKTPQIFIYLNMVMFINRWKCTWFVVYASIRTTRAHDEIIY